ncbi:ankyrin and armadillo repeat-containing protein-like isoform X2 [Lytechinus variegatus]|uniref:ankyrin and armadillo repeat-containing protein-like isoform X2 n=1 Tax=Lytechinus variegatus TaxID=7654 RepID=UPI001BB11155|nr:ankyrin and armadillo repeat-containing protein-like isoform X2 [Lytechinus variegatus]
MFSSTRQEVEKDEFAKERAIMNDLDDNGWSHIHHAAYHGYIKSIEKFVGASEDQLEFPTNDDKLMTPILLAVDSGKLDTVECLVKLGSDLRYQNTQNQGPVEIAALKQYIDILEYFIKFDHKDLPVWPKLMKFMGSDMDDEAEAAGKMLVILTKPLEKGLNPYWEPIVQNNGVPVMMKVIKSMICDKAKLYAFTILLNIIQAEVVKEQIVKAAGIPTALKMITSTDREMVYASSCILCHLSMVKDYIDSMVQNGAIPIMVKLWQTCTDTEILVQVTETVSQIASANAEYQKTIGNSSGALTAVVGLFENDRSKSLLLALTRAVSNIVCKNMDNQNMFVDEGGASALISLAGGKYNDLQLSAISAIHMLAQDNPHTQKIILEEGGVIPLMQLLKRSGSPNVHVCTASALWALAGEDIDERRSMASMIGVNLLIDFLNAQAENDILHYIGAEGLAVLAQGALNKQDTIANANGVQPLVRLLRSPKEHIVLSTIRALRHLCIGIGFIPHAKNQATILGARGIRYLVALMVHSRNELVRVESALSLGYCSIGNSEVMNDISENVDFDYIHILRRLHSSDNLVRLLAGSALAAFAYNNVTQQKEIAESGGIRYHSFVPFLESNDEFFRCNAAFQVVVLARIIPDEDQATTSAIGIKLLVDLLQQSKNPLILALTAECIARLAHTRAGVPAAVVSIKSVDVLCQLMLAENEQVRGSAAIALGYLSFNHKAERKMLNRCRQDPYLFKVLKYYTQNYRLSQAFLEAWKHYQHIGLPPIDTAQKPCLVGKKNMPFLSNIKNPNGRRFTILSSGEESGLSHHLSSPMNPSTTSYPDDATVITDNPTNRGGSVTFASGTESRNHRSVSNYSHRAPSTASNHHKQWSHPSTAKSLISEISAGGMSMT